MGGDEAGVYQDAKVCRDRDGILRSWLSGGGFLKICRSGGLVPVVYDRWRVQFARLQAKAWKLSSCSMRWAERVIRYLHLAYPNGVIISVAPWFAIGFRRLFRMLACYVRGVVTGALRVCRWLAVRCTAGNN